MSAIEKLQNPNAEIRAIMTVLCSSNEEFRSAILARCDTTYFAYPPMNEAFERLQTLMKAASTIPGRDVFLDDHTLGDETRTCLSGDDVAPVNTQDDLEQLLHQLNVARQFRCTQAAALGITNQLKTQKANIQDSIDLLEQSLLEIKAENESSISIYHTGVSNNTDAVIDRILDTSSRGNFVPSGFANFDNRTGGFRKGELIVVASHYKGGKSVVKLNMLNYQYLKCNLSVCDLTLEMKVDEEWERLISLKTGIDFNKIHKKDPKNPLTMDEEDRIRAAYKAHDKHGFDNNCRFSIYPAAHMSLSQLELMLKPYNFDVIAVDYVNLLVPDAGRAMNNEVQQLGAFYQELKRMANKLNCVIIALTQLDKNTGDIRYARSAKEHANTVWSWMYGDAERAMHVLKVKQLAARSHEPFTFFLRENFQTMEVTDHDGEIFDDNPEEETEAFGGQKKWKKSA